MSDPFNAALGGMTQQGTPSPAQSSQTSSTEPSSTQSTQAQAPAWMAQLSKDLQGAEDLRSFSKIDELAVAFRKTSGEKEELAKKLEQASAIPSKDAPKEAWDKFYSNLGRPEAPDKYQITREGDLAKIPPNEGWDQSFKALAHGLNLTASQANTLYNKLGSLGLEAQKQAVAAADSASAQAKAELQKLWGREYDTKLEATRKAYTAFFGEKEAKMIDASGLGNSPAFMDKLAGLTKYMTNDRILVGSNSGSDPASVARLIFTK